MEFLNVTLPLSKLVSNRIKYLFHVSELVILMFRDTNGTNAILTGKAPELGLILTHSAHLILMLTRHVVVPLHINNYI